MSIQRLFASVLAIIASCNASGIGHLHPVPVKSFPIVRYAPFFNFPTGARSIHAVASPPLLPAAVPAPFIPAPAPVIPAPPPFSAPALLPAPAFPAPTFPAPAFPAPTFPAPGFPAPVITSAAPLPPLAPIFSNAFPYFTPTLPRLAPYVPALPRLAPVVPALPQSAFYARAVPALPAAPFSPIIRPVAATLPAPVFGPPAPIAVAKALPFGVHAYAPQIPYAPAAPLTGNAWKK